MAKRLKNTGIVAGATLVLVLMLAWWDGGERELRPIEQPVSLPESDA